jgi:hypothetical protein
MGANQNLVFIDTDDGVEVRSIPSEKARCPIGLTYQQAKELGIEQYWPTSEAKNDLLRVIPPPVSKAPSDGMNKLERRFFCEAVQEFGEEVYREPFKLVLAGNTTYLPDFAAVTDNENQHWLTTDERLKWIISGLEWNLPMVFHPKVFLDIDLSIQGRQITCYEVKGFMRDDAAVKLKVAASMYPCFRWVLVQRDRRRWRCIEVTDKGFSREEWCPDWLR